MESGDNLSELPGNFSGQVRLFPLAEPVLYPHVVQGLRFFEPRYLELLEESLQGDELIGMAVLAPGWESQAAPSLFPSICIGRVVSHQRLDDGSYNVLVLGVRRARILREIPSDTAFRRAQVELVKEVEEDGQWGSLGDLRRFLSELAGNGGISASLEAQWGQLLDLDVTRGAMADMVTHALPLPLAVKMQLLSEPNVMRRLEILANSLEGRTASDRSSKASRAKSVPQNRLDDFPPPFSCN